MSSINMYVSLIFFSRCQLSTRWCQDHQNDKDLRCTIRKPVKHVYSFVSLPGM